MSSTATQAERDAAEHAKVERVIEAARYFVRTADEFFPEYPEAMGSAFEVLERALAAMGDDEQPQVTIPLYEA